MRLHEEQQEQGLEQEIVRLGARLFLGTARDEELLERLHGSPDASRLLHIASREGMTGILAAQLRRLARHKELELPLTHLSRALRGVFVHNGAHLAALFGLRQKLRRESVELIVLKGGALIPTVYGGELGLRPLSDIDLLVKPAELSIVQAVLHELGFVTPSSSSSLFTKGLVAFDLHTDLIGSARIRRRASAFQLDSLCLWEKAVPLECDACDLLILSDPHQFLHLAVHALKHSYSRLVWLVDLALVSRRIDWKELLEEAEASGTMRALAYALRGLESLLGVTIPPSVRDALPPLHRLERVFVSRVATRRETMHLGEIVVACSIPTRRGKMGYLFELAFPRRRVLAELYPGTPRWLLFPRRCAQILLHGPRAVTRRRGPDLVS